MTASLRLQVRDCGVPVQAKTPAEEGAPAPLANETLSMVAPGVVGSTVAYRKLGV
jgi:hypothetical protein